MSKSEEDGEWEVSPSEYKKLCQRDDFRALLKRMRSEDVPAESNAVSTSSSVAASQSVVFISDSSTQGEEWVPKRTRIVDTTMVNSFEADANSVTISIPLETASDADADAHKSFFAMEALYNSAENLED